MGWRSNFGRQLSTESADPHDSLPKKVHTGMVSQFPYVLQVKHGAFSERIRLVTPDRTGANDDGIVVVSCHVYRPQCVTIRIAFQIMNQMICFLLATCTLSENWRSVYWRYPCHLAIVAPSDRPIDRLRPHSIRPSLPCF